MRNCHVGQPVKSRNNQLNIISQRSPPSKFTIKGERSCNDARTKLHSKRTYGNAERKIWVLQGVGNVRNDVGLVNGDGEDLTLAVHTKDAAGLTEWRRHEDGLGAEHKGTKGIVE